METDYKQLINGKLYPIDLLQKHGSHNQETHGNWAKGGEGKKVTGLINKLYEKKTPGFSINIKSRKTPKTGYMCSEKGFEETIPVEEFYKSRDVSRKYLVDYMKRNADSLSKRGAYFGAWVNDGKVWLDVSRRYDTKQAGIDAGVSNEQEAIYDVKNDSFIYVGGKVGEANKAVANGSSETSQSDDGAGIGSVRRRDFERDGEVEDDDFNPLESETLTAHTSNGRTLGIRPGEFVTKKHQQHDQSTHGNWASFGSDSSSLARNGAKQYAKQIGLDPDTSIDYKTVVANQARASKIADEYDKLPDFDREAVDEFQTLAREVNSQFDFMTKKLNVKVQFVKNDPYKTSKEMFKDVDKGVLKVLSTESTGGHPVFSNEQNDKFRAVHDFFGHAATGRGFGQDGEEAAWVHHSQMFTPKARLALTTETRGQNSWYNIRKNGFAKQKVALLPEEFVLVPETFEKHGTHDQSSHAGSRRRIGGDTETAQPKKPQGEQEVTDPNAPKPKLKPGRKPDASGTLEQRAEKLARGERVQVSKSEAKQFMEIMAKRSDDPDLTNLHVQDTQLYDEDNLGIPRNKMPQVPSDTKGIFITEMEKRGARVQRGVADPTKLHPIQAEMSATKVALIMKRLEEKGTKTDDGGRIIISKDNYVIDGHHRWAATSILSFQNPDIKLPVIKVDLNHRELIDATLAWNEATGIKPIGMGESNKPGQIRKAWAEFDSILAKAVRAKTVIRFQPGLKPIIKHQQHDQKTHGSWATQNEIDYTPIFINETLPWAIQEAMKRGYGPATTMGQIPSDDTIPEGLRNLHDTINYKSNPQYLNAVDYYTGENFKDINDMLRRKTENLSSESLGYTFGGRIVNELDELIAKTPGTTETIEVYRGVKTPYGIGELKVGQGFKDNAYTSTTLDPRFALTNFSSPERGKILKISVPKGTKGIYVPKYFGSKDERLQTAKEQEFILPRGSSFRITNILGNVIEVEMMPSE